MPWITEFTREDYAPFAYLLSRIELLYWSQTEKEDLLDELAEAGNKKIWLETLSSMVETQTAELSRLQKFPPLRSNYLQAVNDINLGVAGYKLDRYKMFHEDSARYWEDWEAGQLDRLKDELKFDHVTLSRMSNLVDYTDPDFRSPALLYRLLDLFVLIIDPFSRPGITSQFTSTLNTFNKSTTIAEAKERIEELIEFSDKEIADWTDHYLERVHCDFGASVVGTNTTERGREQLIGLTKEVYRCLAEIYRELLTLVETLPEKPDSGDPSVDWEKVRQTMDQVTLSFSKYPECQLNRAIFINAILVPTETKG